MPRNPAISIPISFPKVAHTLQLILLANNTMDATKKWLRRNRTNFAIGFGIAGLTYVTGQYILTKIADARERMTGDRISKEKSVFYLVLRK